MRIVLSGRFESCDDVHREREYIPNIDIGAKKYSVLQLKTKRSLISVSAGGDRGAINLAINFERKDAAHHKYPNSKVKSTKSTERDV